MENHSIIELIQQSNYLPKIPTKFGEALNMLLEPLEFDMEECIDKLNAIPELETALVQALNYSSRLDRKILTLRDAVLYLGAKNTRMVAIAYITKLLLPNRNGRAKIFNNKKYWKHCIATSIAGYLIAAETGLCDKDRIFTYGLVHDIGVTVLDICLPEHLDKIYTLQQEQGLHQIVAEKIVLGGKTHADIGMWICKEWGLPEEIIEIVAYHHTPFVAAKTSNEVKIIHLADSISTNYYEKLMGTNTTFIYSDKTRQLLNISKEFIEQVAEKLPKEVDKLNRIVKFEF